MAGEQPRTAAIKKIRSAGPLKDLMTEYFHELDQASKTGEAKVAWCTSVGPAELLRSFGFRVYFPENHGALHRHLAAGRRIHSGRQRRRLLARHLLLSYERCRRVLAEGDTAHQGVRPRCGASPRRAGLQHQSVPGRSGLVRLLPARIQGADDRHRDASQRQRADRRAGPRPGRPAPGPDPDARAGVGQTIRPRPAQGGRRVILPLHVALETRAAPGVGTPLAADLLRRHHPHGARPSCCAATRGPRRTTTP